MKQLKLSAYIKLLEQLREKHGDIPVIKEADASSGHRGYPDHDQGYYPWPASKPKLVGIAHGADHDDNGIQYSDRVVHPSHNPNSLAISVAY